DLDLLTGVPHRALEALDIDEEAAGEDGLQLLHAELLEAVRVIDLLCCQAVVEAHFALVAILAQLDADMAEAVELRAGLTDLGGEELVVVDELVRTERAAGRTARNAQREDTRPEQRHAGFVDAADFVDLAVLD